MKTLKILLPFFLFYLSFHDLFAQTQDFLKAHKVRIYQYSEDLPVNGYLYQLKESSLVLSTNLDVSAPGVQFKEFSIPDIKKLKIQRKGTLGNRILMGGLIGFGAGGLIGLLGGNDEDCFVCLTAGERAVISGISLGLAGALIGGLTYNVKISIKGNHAVYDQKKAVLKKYLIE